MRSGFAPLLLARLLLGCAALFALSACSESRQEAADPLLYEVANADGEVQGWLLGTMHALPDGVDWRTDTIEQVKTNADLLMVEVAELDNQSAIAMTFGELASTEGLGPLSERIAPDLRDELAEIVARSDFPGNTFDNTESWAAALMLARVDAYGDPANGVDRALIRAFAGREVRGFETAEQQLGVFDRLAEQDQRDLVEGTVREWAMARENPGKLTRAWMAGDIASLERATNEGIMADPELREALLVGRNRAWMPKLLTTLAEPQKPLVAVGTAHIVGPEGLVAMLEQNGYRVTRLD